MMAESLFEQGKSAEALPFLNQVRNRAGLSDLTIIDKETIMQERRIELAFEGKRWHDLVRSGQAVNITNSFTHLLITSKTQLHDRAGQLGLNNILTCNLIKLFV